MFVDEVSHLGHILTYNLNDKQDIIRVAKDMNRKANSILCKFSALDCAIKCYLINLTAYHYMDLHYGLLALHQLK